MSHVIPLPPDPDVKRFELLVEDLQLACKSDGSQAAGRSLVARQRGFLHWAALIGHIEALADAHSQVAQFEAAADAIVCGEAPKLGNLLRENPGLVQARSTREHHSTLLHYVSANGIEDFRQKTPKNIVEIASLLLKAGADVNAESDAYGGRSTTLGLTATSCHPENAGVQIPIIELLIGNGAMLDDPGGGSIVNSCLANGRGQAAEFLANQGARLDLEGAAGVGRLDIVQGFFNGDGSLKPTATPAQRNDGFAWACEFGRTDVVEFLLDHGVEVSARLRRNHGQTGLHWAAYGGDVNTVALLLKRNAPVDILDESFDATPLGWAIHAWSNDQVAKSPDGFYQVAALLVAAGAQVDPSWLDGQTATQKFVPTRRCYAHLRESD